MKRPSRVVGLLCALFLCCRALTGAQAPAATFEVASVKPNKSGQAAVTVEFQATRVRLLNMQLRPIIQLAYGINAVARLAGIPDWANTERFDIEGTAASIATRDVARTMLQALLAERFKLDAHMEKRQLPSYTLVQTRRDGTFGPAMKVSTVTCTAPGAPPPADGSAVPCGPRPRTPGHLIFVATPMAQFANTLSVMLGRTIVDKTGLTERYDIELMFAPPTPPPGVSPTLVPTATDNGPSVFTALQEQAGLKLDPSTEMVDVLVVTHLERPTEN